MTTTNPASPVAATDVVVRPCPDCDGDGFTVRGTCDWCHGTGKWNEEEQNRSRYEVHPVGTAAEITRLRAEVATWPKWKREMAEAWAQSLRQPDPCRCPARCNEAQTCVGGCVHRGPRGG